MSVSSVFCVLCTYMCSGVIVFMSLYDPKHLNSFVCQVQEAFRSLLDEVNDSFTQKTRVSYRRAVTEIEVKP